jgi:hypothetical protein
VAGRVNEIERRHAVRVPPEVTPWHPIALLRPGQEVTLINVSCGGALLESGSRIKPGARTELHLSGPLRRSIAGRVDRCRVTSLEPLRYEAAIVFEQQLDWNGSYSGTG